MSATDVVAVVAATVAAIVAGGCLVSLVGARRAARDLRAALTEFEQESRAAVEELRAATRHAAHQVDRVDRLVTAAGSVEARVDAASRLAQRTLQSPVVKAMALREGVSRASHRLRVGSDTGRRRARRAGRASG
jgi:hypothetical protein